MKVIQGDLIELAIAGRFDVIVHGCNCRCVMGAGIARQIKQRFPQAFAADQRTGQSTAKLGTISTALHTRTDGSTLVIVNAYTQPRPGPCVDLEALAKCFDEVANRYPLCVIGYPKIGAGLGGGDWAAIAPVIDRALAGEDHTLVEWAPG